MTILAVEDNKVQQVRIEPADYDEVEEDTKNSNAVSSG